MCTNGHSEHIFFRVGGAGSMAPLAPRSASGARYTYTAFCVVQDITSNDRLV